MNIPINCKRIYLLLSAIILIILVCSNVSAQGNPFPPARPSEAEPPMAKLREDPEPIEPSLLENEFSDMAVELFYTGKILCTADPACPITKRAQLQQQQADIEKRYPRATLLRVLKSLQDKCNLNHRCPKEEKIAISNELNLLK